MDWKTVEGKRTAKRKGTEERLDTEKKKQEVIIIPGRLVYVDGRLNNNKLRLVNVYAPALKGERLDFFKHLPNVLCTNRIVIMGGDFNTYLEGEYDFTAQYLKNVLGDYNLADIYRRHDKKGIGHTWRNSRGAKLSLRPFIIHGGI
uniref:Endonuclease/exonuclease/phosphatase domain-containing protein n=1 Tax=Salmo trutta TaxID=8032 RepID=A0A673WHL8_SALTR